jgi:nitrite reductase (NO-forming)
MPGLRIPVEPIMPDPTEPAEPPTNRRAFLQRAAGVGLTLPTLAGLATTAVAGQEATPPADGAAGSHGHGGYVGSDASTSGSTGTATPAPAAAPQPFTVYDPVLPTVQPGPKQFTVAFRDATLTVANEVLYAGWTFDGTIPGRPLRVVEGDTVTLTVRNEAPLTHSLDTHAAKTPPEINYRNLAPGEEFTWSFVATTPGAFMYHCGTPPALMHIGAGMYGAMIVDPKDGWPPAQELVLVQSEFYFENSEEPVKVPSMAKMMLGSGGFMDYVTFNGHATQYVDNPIQIRVGEPVRIFVVNAGPNVWSSFHVVGAVFDRVCVNANPRNQLFGLQSVSIGPGDGACVEFTIEEPGTYIAVNHAFGHAVHGAVALIQAE